MLKINEKLISSANYSTSEKVIGRWIDGKKLYRQIIDVGNLTNATLKDINLTQYGIDGNLVKKWEIYAKDNSSGFLINITTSWSTMAGVIQVRSFVYTGDNYNVLRIASGNNQDMRTYNAYAIIEYTKTTD